MKYMYIELWISLYRSVFVLDCSASFPMLQWKCGNINSVEVKLQKCGSMITIWNIRIRNRLQHCWHSAQKCVKRENAIDSEWHADVRMYDKKVICHIVSALMVITTRCVVFFTVVNQDLHSGCFWIVCGLCWNVQFNYDVDQGSSGD